MQVIEAQIQQIEAQIEQKQVSKPGQISNQQVKILKDIDSSSNASKGKSTNSDDNANIIDVFA